MAKEEGKIKRFLCTYISCANNRCWCSPKRTIYLVLFALFVVSLISLSACGNEAVSLGAELEENGDLPGAVLVYQEALKKDPDNVKVLSALGANLAIMGRFDEALPIQEKVVRLDKKDAQTRIDLGFNYLNHQDRPADAVIVMGEAAKIETTAKNLTFFAQAQKASGDLAGAEKSLREAIETDAEYAWSYRLLIGLLEGSSRMDEAKEIRSLAESRGINIKEE